MEGPRGSGKDSGVLFPFPTLTSSLAPPVSLLSWEEAADLRILLCTVCHSREPRKSRASGVEALPTPAGSCRVGGHCRAAPQHSAALEAAL